MVFGVALQTIITFLCFREAASCALLFVEECVPFFQEAVHQAYLFSDRALQEEGELFSIVLVEVIWSTQHDVAAFSKEVTYLANLLPAAVGSGYLRGGERLGSWFLLLG